MKRQKTVGAVPARTATSDPAPTREANLLDTLITQEVSPNRQQRLLHGVLVGQIQEILPDARVRVALPALDIAEVCATPVCPLAQLAEGVQCALMFAQGDMSRPLVIGPMAHTVTQNGEPLAPREAALDDERIVLVAEQEIELRCGEAAITLTRDGRILLRGQYITDHASATRRIRGGAEQIN